VGWGLIAEMGRLTKIRQTAGDLRSSMQRRGELLGRGTCPDVAAEQRGKKLGFLGSERGGCAENIGSSSRIRDIGLILVDAFGLSRASQMMNQPHAGRGPSGADKTGVVRSKGLFRLSRKLPVAAAEFRAKNKKANVPPKGPAPRSVFPARILPRLRT